VIRGEGLYITCLITCMFEAVLVAAVGYGGTQGPKAGVRGGRDGGVKWVCMSRDVETESKVAWEGKRWRADIPVTS
jgi:hypothetical protein